MVTDRPENFLVLTVCVCLILKTKMPKYISQCLFLIYIASVTSFRASFVPTSSSLRRQNTDSEKSTPLTVLYGEVKPSSAVTSAALIVSLAFGGVAPAHATYSSYTGEYDSREECVFALENAIAASLVLIPTYLSFSARENDWNQRMVNKEIHISSARSLKAQLNELVPENQNGQRQLFCPNGESSAVTPLQENRCGDRLATVSVFGRDNDVVGNSIPIGTGTTIASGLGKSGETAFPSYFK